MEGRASALPRVIEDVNAPLHLNAYVFPGRDPGRKTEIFYGAGFVSFSSITSTSFSVIPFLIGMKSNFDGFPFITWRNGNHPETL